VDLVLVELSAAAERALRLARRLAAAAGQPAAEPIHLLMGILWETESRGWQLIKDLGSDPHEVAQRVAQEHHLPEALTDHEVDVAPSLQALLRASQQKAEPSGSSVPTGTDQLLRTLLRGDPHLCDSLRRAGVAVEQLLHQAEALEPRSSAELCYQASPIPFDEGFPAACSPQSPGRPAEPVQTFERGGGRKPSGPSCAGFGAPAAVLVSRTVGLLDELAWRIRTEVHDGRLAERIETVARKLLDTWLLAAANCLSPESSEGTRGMGNLTELCMQAQLLLVALRHQVADGPLAVRFEVPLTEGTALLRELTAKAFADGFGQPSLRRRLDEARLYVLVGEQLCRHPLEVTTRAAARGGAQIIQLREKLLPDRELYRRAELLRQVTEQERVLFVVNDRPDVAHAVGADGVHVGQEELPVAAARRVVGPWRLVGLSTHSLAQAQEAEHVGADYIGVGPVFPSPTKSFESYPGLELVRAVAQTVLLPAFAIGGITLENVDRVLEAGARRIAVSSAVCQAEDPEWAAAVLRARLDAWWASSGHGGGGQPKG
jgi:thiamine-phosphate pyrophosphorylase